MNTTQKGHGLLLRFGMIFLVFTVVTLLIAGGTTYVNQTRIYQEQQEKNLQNIAEYLSIVLQTDSMDFAAYQRFFLQHSQEMRVPVNFGDAELAASKERFESLFAETYPGRVPGGRYRHRGSDAPGAGGLRSLLSRAFSAAV